MLHIVEASHSPGRGMSRHSFLQVGALGLGGLSLTDGAFLDAPWPAGKQKVPVRPFVVGLVKKGSAAQKNYVPSLDPVRTAGKVAAP